MEQSSTLQRFHEDGTSTPEGSKRSGESTREVIGKSAWEEIGRL
jgi:hypothetical protein